MITPVGADLSVGTRYMVTFAPDVVANSVCFCPPALIPISEMNRLCKFGDLVQAAADHHLTNFGFLKKLTFARLSANFDKHPDAVAHPAIVNNS